MQIIQPTGLNSRYIKIGLANDRPHHQELFSYLLYGVFYCIYVRVHILSVPNILQTEAARELPPALNHWLAKWQMISDK